MAWETISAAVYKTLKKVQVFNLATYNSQNMQDVPIYIVQLLYSCSMHALVCSQKCELIHPILVQSRVHKILLVHCKNCHVTVTLFGVNIVASS